MTENTIHQTITPAEVRQSLLSEIEASKQMVAELSDEQLEEVHGGIGGGSIRATISSITDTYNTSRAGGQGFFESVKTAFKEGPKACFTGF